MKDDPDEKQMSINEAIKAVLEECPDRGTCAYAKTYARATMDAVTRFGKEGLRVQVLYILSNLRCWRGERAREVKKVLKAFTES